MLYITEHGYLDSRTASDAELLEWIRVYQKYECQIGDYIELLEEKMKRGI